MSKGKKAPPGKKTSSKSAKKAVKSPKATKKPSSSKKAPTGKAKAKASSLKKKVAKAIQQKKRPAKKTAPPKKPLPKPSSAKKATPAAKPPAPPAVATPAPLPEPAPVAKSETKKSSSKKAPLAVVDTGPPPPPVEKRPSPTMPGSTVTKGGAIFYDSHMHTPLCKHAWGEPEEYAEQGLKAGLKGIIFTCHCPMPDGFWPTVRMAESEFDLYVDLVNRARDKYKGKFDVWLGLESEYFPGYERYVEELHQKADFHFILGSVHWQAKEYLTKFESGTIENFRRTYFDQLAASAESGLYDCLAHPDLVKNYNPDSWCFAIVKNHVARCLDRIAATGVAMELNTSGINKSYAEMNPGNEMLEMMAQRGIPVVIGSDAHRAVRVGDGFLKALENLKVSGYEEVNYFEWRKRKSLKIDDVIANLKKLSKV